MSSIKLPLQETASVSSIKLPIKETVWVLDGFVIAEDIVGWKEKQFTIIETVKSKIYLDVSLIDKSHVLLKWSGDSVPKVRIFKKRETDELWDENPVAILDWNLRQYIMELDSNGYEILVDGISSSGEADLISVGMNQEYKVNTAFTIPLNEKYYFFDINLPSVYRFEVNL